VIQVAVPQLPSTSINNVTKKLIINLLQYHALYAKVFIRVQIPHALTVDNNKREIFSDVRAVVNPVLSALLLLNNALCESGIVC